MCSCGQEVAGRTHGDEGAFLFKIKAEEGYWKRERRSDDAAHLLWASNHARHAHSLVISSTFIECPPEYQVSEIQQLTRQLLLSSNLQSLRKQINKQAKVVREAVAGKPDVRSRGEILAQILICGPGMPALLLPLC